MNFIKDMVSFGSSQVNGFRGKRLADRARWPKVFPAGVKRVWFVSGRLWKSWDFYRLGWCSYIDYSLVLCGVIVSCKVRWIEEFGKNKIPVCRIL